MSLGWLRVWLRFCTVLLLVGASTLADIRMQCSRNRTIFLASMFVASISKTQLCHKEVQSSVTYLYRESC